MDKRKCILITGGAGYIGIHLAQHILKTMDYSVIVVDDMSLSNYHNINILQNIWNTSCQKLDFYDFPLQSIDQLKFVFARHTIECVIHLAGYKSVKEAVQNPIKYYDNNLNATLALLKIMKEYNVNKIIFSSTALVYGKPLYLPMDEKHPINAGNAYSRSKYMIEKIIEDSLNAESAGMSATILRYFNPIGHNSIFEPEGGDYLYPNLLKTMLEGKDFHIYGNDWTTRDGTCVRDFIHIDDLVEAHIFAMVRIIHSNIGVFKVYNIGIGTGTSIRELVTTLLNLNTHIKVVMDERREGDLAEYYANVELANTELGWTANYNSIEKIIERIVSNLVEKIVEK